jgi:branched-chain amino acid transport system permease protein
MIKDTAVGQRLRSLGRSGTALVLLLIGLMLLPVLTKRPVVLGLAILTLLYAVLGQAWNILGGYTGQVSLGNAIYFGIGAYTSTVLLLNWAVNPWLGMLVGAVLAVLCGLVVGLPTFRLRGHYFVTATIVINEVIRVVFTNWDFVGGARGLYVPIEQESLLHFQFHKSKVPYYYVILVLFLVAILVTWLIERSKWGYYFKAIRDDADAAASLGVNVAYYKHVANGANALLTAIAGTFYAQYVLFLDPASVFSVWISVLVLLIPVLGGKGTLWGPILGAFVLMPLSELTRIYLGGQGRAIHLVLYGLLIMIIAVMEPRGLMALAGRFSLKRFRRGG